MMLPREAKLVSKSVPFMLIQEDLFQGFKRRRCKQKSIQLESNSIASNFVCVFFSAEQNKCSLIVHTALVCSKITLQIFLRALIWDFRTMQIVLRALKLISHYPNSTHGSSSQCTEPCLLLGIFPTHVSDKTLHNPNTNVQK